MRLKDQKGFTLLELIVVCTILGVLALISIPQYNSLREKGERTSILSDCGSIYRMFVVSYVENDRYPNATAGDYIFNLNTLYPLTDSTYMGGIKPEIDIPFFLKKFQNDKAEDFDSPDIIPGDNQKFYLILAWKKDPSLKYVVAQSDDVFYGDGSTKVDNGNWIDGVFATKGGEILYK